MAIKRTSSNSISNAVKLSTGFSSAAIPNSPTIGTATATSDVAATVTYTAAVLGATGSTFTATSNPGSVTGTGSSPITVTGLTASTSYTFSVTAGNANGTSAASSASNSVTTSAPLNSYESIATVSVGSGGQASIEFTSIPATFAHLQVRGITRSDAAGLNQLYFQFNSDTGSNYANHILYADGTQCVTSKVQPYDRMSLGLHGGSSTTANIFGACIVDITDYATANKYRTARSLTGCDANGSGYVWLSSGLWLNTNAITSIKIFPENGNFVQYSSLALYGIKGV